MNKKTRLSLFFTAVLCVGARPVSAEGLRIIGHSMDAQSRGEAVIASVEDASAVWYNPAALTRAGRFNLSLNYNNLVVSSRYRDLASREEENKMKHFILPSLFMGSDLGTERWAVGLGVNSPFGLGSEYSKTSAFRYITTGGRVSVLNVNPTVACKVHPALSVGAGLDYYYSTVELNKQYPWFAVSVPALGAAMDLTRPDGSVKVEGKGDGWGFNTGLLFQPVPEHSLGLSYRSQVVVKYSGKDAELSQIPAILQPAFPAGTGSVYRTGAKSYLRFPDVFNFGYAYSPGPRWVWEIGGQWTNWEDFQSIDVNLDQPVAGLFPNSSTPLNWRNGWDVRTGGRFGLTDSLFLSGGYIFNKAPLQEGNYTPMVPDGDRHILSLGAALKFSDFTVHLPAFLIFQSGPGGINSKAAEATGTQNVDGDYELFAFQTGIGVTYAFGRK